MEQQQQEEVEKEVGSDDENLHEMVRCEGCVRYAPVITLSLQLQWQASSVKASSVKANLYGAICQYKVYHV